MTIAAVSTVTPRFPQTVIEMPNFSTDSAVVGARRPTSASRTRSRTQAYEQAGLGPEDMQLAEVYDLSTALELDWYENIGLCKPGEAERLLRNGDTTIGGRIPVNPSGGLGCFGEAIPAQAIAQVCELTWQIRGQAGERQVAGRARRRHGEPGPVRPRLVGDREGLTPRCAWLTRRADAEQIAFFREHGWLVVEDAVDAAELAEVDARCEVILEKKDKLAFDWAWEKGKDEGRARVQDRAEQRRRWCGPRSRRRAVPALDDRVRLGADAARRSSSGTTSTSPSRRATARRPTGTRTRATGAATSTIAASPAGCRCTTSTSATAACTSSTAVTATACSSTASPSTSRAICSSASPTSRACVACPIRAGSVTFHHGKTPHMTPPNVERRLAARGDDAHARRRARTARATTTRGRCT